MIFEGKARTGVQRANFFHKSTRSQRAAKKQRKQVNSCRGYLLTLITLLFCIND